MNTLVRRLLRSLQADDGPTATEYALLVGLICVAAISALSNFGNHMTNLWTAVDGTMPGAGGP